MLPVSSKKIPYSRAVEFGRTSAIESTPFDLDKIYMLATASSDSRVGPLALIKRDAMNNFLDGVVAKGVRPEKLGIERHGSTLWVSRRALEGLHPAFAHLVRRRQLRAFSCAVLLLAFGGSYVHFLQRYDSSEAELSTVVDSKRTEALQARRVLDEQQKRLAAVEAARIGKRQSVPVARVWEEVTQALPDDAWLTDLRLDDGTVTMTGYAARSSQLITNLSSSETFRDPTFISPVVRVPGQEGERFELRAQVRQP